MEALMPAIGDEAGIAADVDSRAVSRLEAIDSLLPGRIGEPVSCGARFTALAADGTVAATADCEHWAGSPESLDIVWGAAAKFRLVPSVAGPEVRGPLDDLLTQWTGHLAGVPGADTEDSAAVVNWPSRDVAGIRALLKHGFRTHGVVAARRTRRPDAGTVAGAAAGTAAGSDAGSGSLHVDGVLIRRAGPADIDEVARLGLEVVRYDSYFGGVVERPHALEALRRELPALLTGTPYTWLAEAGGRAVGLLAAERPAEAGWIAPLTRLSPVAYLMLMYVTPELRGSGIGAEMVRLYHRDLAKAEIPVSLLHHEQANPLSAPFWNQQGYRPLWTSWERRPTRGLAARP
jgi:GNAT superfamily N-acetyltransferase